MQDMELATTALGVTTLQDLEAMKTIKPATVQTVEKLQKLNQQGCNLYATVFYGIRICLVTQEFLATPPAPPGDFNPNRRVLELLNATFNPFDLQSTSTLISHDTVLALRRKIYLFLMSTTTVNESLKGKLQIKLFAEAELAGGWSEHIRPSISQYFDLLESTRRVTASVLNPTSPTSVRSFSQAATPKSILKSKSSDSVCRRLFTETKRPDTDEPVPTIHPSFQGGASEDTATTKTKPSFDTQTLVDVTGSTHSGSEVGVAPEPPAPDIPLIPAHSPHNRSMSADHKSRRLKAKKSLDSATFTASKRRPGPRPLQPYKSAEDLFSKLKEQATASQSFDPEQLVPRPGPFKMPIPRPPATPTFGLKSVRFSEMDKLHAKKHFKGLKEKDKEEEEKWAYIRRGLIDKARDTKDGRETATPEPGTSWKWNEKDDDEQVIKPKLDKDKLQQWRNAQHAAEEA
ncbi:uncharacterized protein E0L32_005088 [Thyridium curvatum]|uniref:Uncharacterized protein n=1 Tax=Thyridium curvatum TaxID=1093900 RepID=A0A507B4E0_9PEZI|nr:uncharacterized protein E0L32_005088 [Thyridium curvatum]TPX14693.1 hypothetical protein E0L32_005088 [Thyridium curvatum]